MTFFRHCLSPDVTAAQVQANINHASERLNTLLCDPKLLFDKGTQKKLQGDLMRFTLNELKLLFPTSGLGSGLLKRDAVKHILEYIRV